jgi:hypothetical protein
MRPHVEKLVCQGVRVESQNGLLVDAACLPMLYIIFFRLVLVGSIFMVLTELLNYFFL